MLELWTIFGGMWPEKATDETSIENCDAKVDERGYYNWSRIRNGRRAQDKPKLGV
jgi:hypothetical protein